MEQRVREEVDSQQCEQHSKVRIPPHCPKDVILWSNQVLREVSLMGHRIMMQLELNLTFTGPSAIVVGSVTVPENVLPTGVDSGWQIVKEQNCSVRVANFPEAIGYCTSVTTSMDCEVETNEK